LPTALAIRTLPVAVIKSPLGTLLMATVGRAPLSEPSSLATGPTAIALPAITPRAQKEHCAAFAAQANAQPEDHFAIERHASSPAALDNGNHFVTT
jgi:hypothetical protein